MRLITITLFLLLACSSDNSRIVPEDTPSLSSFNSITFAINDLRGEIKKNQQQKWYGVINRKFSLNQDKVETYFETLTNIAVNSSSTTIPVAGLTPDSIVFQNSKTKERLWLEGYQKDNGYYIVSRFRNNKGELFSKATAVSEKIYNKIFINLNNLRPQSLALPSPISKIKYITPKKETDLNQEQQNRLLQLLTKVTFKEYIYTGQVSDSIKQKLKLGKHYNNNLKGYFKIIANKKSYLLLTGRRFNDPNTILLYSTKASEIILAKFSSWENLLKLEKDILKN